MAGEISAGGACPVRPASSSLWEAFEADDFLDRTEAGEGIAMESGWKL
jgi:hypothetical protein